MTIKCRQFIESDCGDMCVVNKYYPMLETSERFLYTPTEEVLIFNYSYIIYNMGNYAAEILLQISADGQRWFDDSLGTMVAGGQGIAIIPATISRFARLCYHHVIYAQPTKLDIYLQGRTL